MESSSTINHVYLGLFNEIIHATISNLVLDGYIKFAFGQAGSVAASVRLAVFTTLPYPPTIISNCISFCRIEVKGSAGYVGGITYNLSIGYKVINCVYAGNIRADVTWGAAIGGISSASGVGGTIINCLNIGTISVNSSNEPDTGVGGIVGIAYNGARISNCINAGPVSINSVTGKTDY
jgi:hypothetical protein